MTPKEIWDYYLTCSDGSVSEAIEMMASDLVATADRVEELSRTGYFRRGQPTRVVNLPVRERREPLDVPSEQAVDL